MSVSKIFKIINCLIVLSLPSLANSEMKPDYDKYFESCRAELGDLPSFTCKQGVKGKEKQFKAQISHRIEEGSRMGSLKSKSNPDTQWTFFCRSNPRSKKFFDVAVIGHNKKNGKTCFFQSEFKSNGYRRKSYIKAKQVLPSTASKKGQQFWSNIHDLDFGSREISCLRCHNADPYVHTPYSRQFTKNRKLITPENPFGPYSPIPLFKHEFFHDNKKHLVSPEVASCTNCHRLAFPGCENLSRIIGKDIYYDQVDFTHASMPPIDNNLSMHKLETKDQNAIKFYNKCCSNDYDKECIWEDIPDGKKESDLKLEFIDAVQGEYHQKGSHR